MISVNQKFIDSCNSDYVLSQLKIKVSTNKTGTVLCTLNDDEFNISSNSVEKQASSGAVCNVGGVCSNRIKIVINQKGIGKLDTAGGFKKNYVLHLIQWNKVDDANQSDTDYSENLDHSENTTGKCDLGFYYISQIKNNYYDCEITAYDGMLAFEKNLTITQLKYMMTNSKTVDEWLAYFCTLVNDSNFNISYTDNTDVTCNDSVTFRLSDDSSFDKIRDAISQLAMLKMAYATIDTQGNLTLKQAIKTNTSTYDDTIDNEYMFNSDNEVIESVIKYFYTSVAGFEYENTYTDQQNRNEINLFLEENKFLRGFEPYNGTGLTAQTLTCLRNMSLEVMGYSFYSCECDINERPYIELGDNIEVERKLVDQQGQVSIISLPLVVDSVGHEIGASTHLTSNSTVGTNEGSNTKTRINSQPKEPSNSQLINMLKSPVTKYTDTTATVAIRLDSEETEGFDQNAYATNEVTPDYTVQTHQVGPWSDDVGYLLTNIEAIQETIKDRKVQEAIDESYIYGVVYNQTNITKLNENYEFSLDIKNGLNNLIGKKFLFFATNSTTSYHKDPVEATLKGIYFYRGQYSNNNLMNFLQRDDVDTATSDGFDSEVYAEIINESFKTIDTYTRIDTGYKVVKQKTRTIPKPSNNHKLTSPNGFHIRADVGESIISTEPNRIQLVNGKLLDYSIGREIVKYWLLCNNFTLSGNTGGLFNTNSFIALRIEYEFNSTPYDVYVPLNLIMAHAGFGEVPTVAVGTTMYNGIAAYTYIKDFIINHNLHNNYRDLLKGLYENIIVNWYEVYLEATYLTSNSPLSQYDKDKVDLGLVNQSDLEELRAQVNQNTADIAALQSYTNEINNDLQDTKQDITQNTQNITALDTRESQDVSGLDARVTALEQSGGGGGGTFVVANPQGTPTAPLNSLQVGSDIYSIPSGGGGLTYIPRSKMQLVTGWLSNDNGHTKFNVDSSTSKTLIIDVRDYAGKFINLVWLDTQNRINRTRVGRLSQMPAQTTFTDTLSLIWMSTETGTIWYPGIVRAGSVGGQSNVGSWGTGFCNEITNIYIDSATQYIGIYYSSDGNISMNDLIIKATVEDPSV